MQFDCRSMDSITVHLTCLSASSKRSSISLHCGATVTQVNKLLKELGVPLVLITNLDNSGYLPNILEVLE